MAKEEVLIGVKVDTKQAQKSLGELEKEQQNYAKGVSAIETKLYEERQKLLTKQTKEQRAASQKRIKQLSNTKSELSALAKSASVEMKKFSDSVDEGLNEVNDDIISIGDSFGSLGAPLASAKQGVSALGQGFKALLANPVVLVIAGIVAGLTALYKAFTRTEEGANKLNVVFAYLEGLMIPLIKGAELLAKNLVAAFENPQQALKDFGNLLVNNIVNRFKGILELIPKLGEAISLVFKGEFAEAGKVATNAIGKVLTGSEDLIGAFEKLNETIKETTEEALKYAAANAELERQEQKLVKLNRENEVLLSKQLKDRELLMNIRDNELLSIEERIKANEDLNKLETEQLNRSKQAAELAVSIAQERIKLDGKTTENLDALKDAQVEYNNILADSAGRQNEYIMNRQGLQREAAEFARAEIEFELEKVNITEKSEEKKLQARIDALEKTKNLYGKDTIEYKEFTKQKELAELELSQYKKDLAEEDAKFQADLKKKQQEEAKAKAEEDAAIEAEKKQASRDAAVESAVQLTNDISNAVFEAEAQNIEREKNQKLTAVEETQSRELEILNTKLERGLISEQEAAQGQEKIEKDAAKKTEKINKEAAKKKQKQDITQAIINGIMAISQIFASTPPPASFILAGAQAITSGIQVAAIKNQKFEKGGVIQGASHSEGGVPFTVDGVGGFEAEGGEVIINKRSASMFKKELSMINQAGGGVKFAKGGVVGSSNPSESSASMTEQLQELIEISKQPTRAVVSETEITDSQNRINNIESRSQF